MSEHAMEPWRAARETPHGTRPKPEEAPISSETTGGLGTNTGARVFLEDTAERTLDLAQEILEREGVMQRMGDVTVFDFDKFSSSEFVDSYNRVARARGCKMNRKIFFDLLHGKRVVSKADYEAAILDGRTPEEKAVFSMPRNLDEAFGESAGADDAYMRPENFFRGQGTSGRFLDSPILLASGESTSLREIKIYNAIFRTLGAERASDGKLYYTDPKTNRRQKFSAAALFELAGSQLKDFATSPMRYLGEYGGNLLRRGILRPEDFQSITTDGYYLADRYRTEKSKPENQPNVMLKGVQYYIGREAFIFEGRRIPASELKFVMLDSDTAGIVQTKLGREALIVSFPLATDDEINRKKSELTDRGITELSGRVFFGKTEMVERISEWDPTDENPPLKDETHQSYARRIRHLADYENIQETSKMFSDSAEIGIHNLSWREQQWLCSGVYSSPGKTDEILRIGKKFGLDGLRAFLSCEYDVRNGDAVLSIGNRLPEDSAASIFEKYGELVESANAVEEQLHEKFRVAPGYSREVAIRISQKLLAKGRDLLVSLAKTDEGDPEKVTATLDAIKVDIELFKNAFRALYEEGVIENFGDVSGVEFGTKSPEELSGGDKDAMRKMYDENYPESAGYSKEFREVIFHGLEEAFTRKEGARFYVLKKDGEMLGYNRFEDLPDTEDGRERKYVGSFNVSPQYRGSKLGDKIFDDCLAQEIVGDMIIEAYADPTLPISSHYLETNGFVATGIENVGGRPLLKIVRDPSINANLATKKIPQDTDEMTRLAGEGAISIRRMPRSDIPSIASDLLEKGWLLTHITRDATDKGTVAAVFEKPR